VYVPRWVALNELSALDVRPRQNARAPAAGEFTPTTAVARFREERSKQGDWPIYTQRAGSRLF
jgi:hypothetical protein